MTFWRVLRVVALISLGATQAHAQIEAAKNLGSASAGSMSETGNKMSGGGAGAKTGSKPQKTQKHSKSKYSKRAYTKKKYTKNSYVKPSSKTQAAQKSSPSPAKQ